MTEKDKVLAEKIKEIEDVLKINGLEKYLISITYLEGEERGNTHMGYSGGVGDIFQMAMRSNSVLTANLDKD